MTPVVTLDDNTYLGAESSYNLFTAAKRRRRYRRQTWNARSMRYLPLGRIPNRFRRRSLASYDARSKRRIRPPPPPPPLKYPLGYLAQSLVGLGVVATLPKRDFLLLNKVQEVMQKQSPGWETLAILTFEVFCEWQRSIKMQNFIDGDLVEILLDLSKEDQDAVSKLSGVANSEDLQRR